MRFNLAAILWIGCAGAAAAAAAADDIEFQSPTGNISCGLYSDGADTSVRCDMSKPVPSYTAPPAGCEFDWGSSLAVSATGKGVLACVSDPAAGPDAPVLPYGEALSLGGISCVSAKTGMTCTNGGGHGFSVALARQRIF